MTLASLVILIVVGFVLLVAGAEVLVRGASRLASAFGVSPLVVGLTVVAFGTSSPEMLVSTVAAWRGTTDLALGNVLGSNIFNTLVILGLCGLISPLAVRQRIVRIDYWIMLAVTVLGMAICLDGQIGFIEGALLFLILVVYTTKAIRMERAQDSEKEEKTHSASGSTWLNVLLSVVGLGLLIVGSNLLVDGATGIAVRLGVSELVIGLTIIAAGTSLPELATSLVAGLKGERDIAVGNVIGSNIFNLLGVLGIGAVVSKEGLPVDTQVLFFDLPLLLGISLLCYPVFKSGAKIDRREGAFFLAIYVAYTVILIIWNQT